LLERKIAKRDGGLHGLTYIYIYIYIYIYEGWNFNNGNYLFTTDTK